MTIYFNGNRFQYEMENVARLFYPLRRIQFRLEADAYEEGDYLAFRREIHSKPYGIAFDGIPLIIGIIGEGRAVARPIVEGTGGFCSLPRLADIDF